MSIKIDRTQGDFVCNFVERLPATGTGRPFNLYSWQTEAIHEFYDTLDVDDDTGDTFRRYWYLYLEIAKKNGKSDLAAALGL